jgi:MinD-like ATPase involved in chromosome partitioning or flagellar assembly
MALVAVAADKGSPGVTTTAVALGAVWPRRALVAECDPAGGDLAYRLPGQGGTPLDPNHGLLSLAATARHGLEPARVWEHVQVLNGGLEVLVGVSTAEQSSGLGSLWGGLGQALARMPEADVVADCGRLGPGAPTLPLLRHAAVLLLVARATVDSVAHARDRLAALAGRLGDGGVAGPALGMVLVTPPRESGAAAEQVGEVLRAARLPAEVLGTIADDPKAARLLSGRWTGRLGGSLLVRSARQLAAGLHARVADEREMAR